ncbi:MAG: M23 family metallopeptidase [candidate division WOR-3 bacterium]
MKRWAFLIIFLGCSANFNTLEGPENQRDIRVEFKDIVVKKGDVFGEIVNNLDFLPQKGEIVKWFSDSVRILNIYDTIRFVFINDTLSRLEIRKLKGIYEYDFSTGSGRFIKRFKEYIPKTVQLVINTSLWDAFLNENLPLELFVEITDIFAWDIDFSCETQSGDTLRMVYSDAGIVYYAEYIGKTTGRRVAVRFRGEYYDDKGNNIRRMFLKSPLKSYVITSGFGIRFHPILREYRPHHGVDYAAPYGSPVHTVASGRVVFAGWKGGYGKTVIIKHTNGYQTLYGHLSRIYVKTGQVVEQGDVIGAVGSTGLSTGPHLHFEIRQHGKLMNPLRIKSEPLKPLPEELKPEFFALLREYQDMINGYIVSR